ncbi:MAG: energy transducer TonB [Bacteroidetes bacterium]|nr:energy transducer TonB [Bacteroidota bacterium]MBU1720868.1 energy transducer TonB [Bacteroidota bacterium]
MTEGKKKKFLKVPEYPGGNEAFRKFILENMKIPEDAVENAISGVVILDIEVDDNGKVGDIVIEKGLGYGCDDEAIRLAKMLKYGKVKNQGIRLKTRKKIRIQFPLVRQKPQVKVSYTSVTAAPKQKETEQKQNYSYTIRVNSDKN